MDMVALSKMVFYLNHWRTIHTICEYSKYFVRALTDSDWMAITKNQKKVMIGNKEKR